MKLKNLAALALVGALVFGLVACSDSEDEAKAISGDKITYTWNAQKAAVALSVAGDDVNAKGILYRAFETLKTKHFSSDPVITIYDAATLADESVNEGDATGKETAKARAGFGYIFGFQDVTDQVLEDVKKESGLEDITAIKVKTKDANGRDTTEKVSFYTFGVASVRWNTIDGKFEWYVSWCTDVPSTCFNYTHKTSFNDTLDVLKKDGETTVEVEFGDKSKSNEEQIVKGDAGKAWKTVDDIALMDADGDGESDDLVVKLIVTAKDGDDAGGYDVQLQSATKNSNGTIAYTDVTGEKGEISKDVTGLEARTQLDIGRYITIYNGQSASGNIKLENIERSALVDEEVVDRGMQGFVVR